MKSHSKSTFIWVASCVAVAAGVSTVTLGQSEQQPGRRTLAQCELLLPRDNQYTLQIESSIDTRAGQDSTVGVTLLDQARPGSVAVPEGSEQFNSCVLDMLGVPN